MARTWREARREALAFGSVDEERIAAAREAADAVATFIPKVVAEAGGWSIFIPGTPVAADGGTFDEAISEMIVALREYAEDWADHLRLAPNHHAHWGLVQLVALSSDDQLAQWLTGVSPR